MSAIRPPVRRSAVLHLRGRDGPDTLRVDWPPRSGLGWPPPLIMVLCREAGGAAPSTADDALCDELSCGLGALILRATAGSSLARARRALEWAADHAAELEGDPGRLVIAGCDQAADVAVQLALAARDEGWPPLRRQILITSAACSRGAHRRAGRPELPAPAEATLVTPQRGSRYAMWLRAEGGHVHELIDRRLDPSRHPDQPFLPSLTAALRRQLAPDSPRSTS